jgi:hypothetical protein
MKNSDRRGNMTKNEENVIQWAFNLTMSIVAGDYHLPKPMNVAINNLQDAVWDLAKERGISVEDGCTAEFGKFKDEFWKDLKEKLKNSN